MLDEKSSARELVVAAGEHLCFGLDVNEIADMANVVQPLLGNEVFAAGREEIDAIVIPDDPGVLARWSTIRDFRYLIGSTQINLMAGIRGTDAKRKREFQIALALIFHAVRVK